MRAVMLKWLVACVVAIGLIAQAAAAVRHNGVMIERVLGAEDAAAPAASAAIRALEIDLRHAICKPGETGLDDETGSRPPRQGDDCPVCNGLAVAFALSPPVHMVQLAALGGEPAYIRPFDQRVTHFRLIRPPSRAPPA